MPTLLLITFVLALSLFGIASLIVGYMLWLSSQKKSYAEPRTIICPENLDYVTVTVDGEHAGRTALEGQEKFRIASCSRWPEMQGCDQKCADQIPLAGDDRAKRQYAAFGMTPEQLRSQSPVAITPEQYDAVVRQKAQYLNRRGA
jgi:hypothetical protein